MVPLERKVKNIENFSIFLCTLIIRLNMFNVTSGYFDGKSKVKGLFFGGVTTMN